MTTLQNIDPMELARQRVAKGVKLLDEKVPGWRERINVDTLDMISPHKCILGQVLGHLDRGRDIVISGLLSEYGFNSEKVSGIDFPDIQSAWLEELNKQPVKV